MEERIQEKVERREFFYEERLDRAKEIENELSRKEN